MQISLLMGLILGMGFILEGCMLMHLTDDHHSGMAGHGSGNHGTEKKSEQHATQHQSLNLPHEKPRRDIQGGIAVEIRFDGIADKGDLAFQVGITDHPSYSEFYKLEETSFLINDQGVKVMASRWRPSSPDPQHVIGQIFFPAQDRAGRVLLAASTGRVTLKIKNLGGIPERVFEWPLGSGN